MTRAIGTLVVMFAFVGLAQARVHTILPTQILLPPDPQPDEGYPALAVAIDGDSIIVIADRPTYRGAFLYRRRAADGRWSYSRTLMQTTVPVAQRRAGLAMKNSQAVIDLAGQSVIWVRDATGWREPVANAYIPLPGGHAISVDRILVGANGCVADGHIYQKVAADSWGYTGRLPSSGTCVEGERDVELNYDFALVNSPAGQIRAYRRNDTATDWVSAGTFQLQGQSAGRAGPLALQKSLAAAPGSTIYRRNGTTWTLDQTLMPADYARGTGDANTVLYRDNALITVEGLSQQTLYATPHVYVLDAAGKFQNVGILETSGNTTDIDISGRRVVAVSESPTNLPTVAVFEIPRPLVPAKAIANDFDTRDVSGFDTTPSGAFALAGNQYASVYRQAFVRTGDTAAVVRDSDWSYYQSVDVRIRPYLLTSPGSWVGVALRYTDANNYYFLSIAYGYIAINRRVKGVNRTLAWVAIPAPSSGRYHDVRFSIEKNPGGGPQGDRLVAELDHEFSISALENSLLHGRAALLTHDDRADFDNLYVSPSRRDGLLFMNFHDDPGRPLETHGGTWTEENDQWPYGVRQSNTGVLATAVGGAPIDDQRVRATVDLESFGSTNPVPWFGVIARYRDPSNYYYLSVRGTDQLQIRKIVNGVTTVLAAKPFTVNPGEVHEYELHAYGDELHAYVDRKLVAAAHDDALPEGRYGVATYHAGAFFRDIVVDQP